MNLGYSRRRTRARRKGGIGGTTQPAGGQPGSVVELAEGYKGDRIAWCDRAIQRLHVDFVALAHGQLIDFVKLPSNCTGPGAVQLELPACLLMTAPCSDDSGMAHDVCAEYSGDSSWAWPKAATAGFAG